MNKHIELNQQQLRKTLNQAVQFEQGSVLQKEILSRLLERLDIIKTNPSTLLDLGAKTGASSQLLQQRYPQAQVIAYDFADQLLAQHRGIKVAGSSEQLPFATQSIDFIFSNLQFHWSNDLGQCFAECLRVLKPNGLLLFSSLGVDTLGELRQSFAAAGLHHQVHDFIDMHHLGDALLAVGFSDPVMDSEWITFTYQNLNKLWSDLKASGATNRLQQRRKGLMGKVAWQAMLAAYEQQRQDGRLPATMEIVYGHAWAPTQQPGSRADSNGEIVVPIHQIKGKTHG